MRDSAATTAGEFCVFWATIDSSSDFFHLDFINEALIEQFGRGFRIIHLDVDTDLGHGTRFLEPQAPFRFPVRRNADKSTGNDGIDAEPAGGLGQQKVIELAGFPSWGIRQKLGIGLCRLVL